MASPLRLDEITETAELAVPIGDDGKRTDDQFSIKHAFAGRRKVGHIRYWANQTPSGRMKTLEYEDDGRGVDSLESHDFIKGDSLGMKLIRLANRPA